ncbi:hypothetical protein QNH20_07815 [Neobacillus sp. WH10]|uniref:hypothetical protein n=1 Tax=Neobacillus sp. WH10 TaxID=3047873 RepID=UPI0024C1B9BD|nr:hypothetical protein [Neobacillus sp. WH10]WHY79025.1 hypothetical protein QNH20_07815 [Neobacillus sp. WH10]
MFDATFWTALAAIASLVTALVTARYTFYTGKMVKGELGPKLFVKGEAIDSGSSYDKEVNNDIGLSCEFREIGFVSDSANKKLMINLVNNGKSPATNIEFKYTIILYKHDVKLEKESKLIDIDSKKLVEYKTVHRTSNFDYLPPNDKVEIEVMYMDLLPFVKLQANSLTSNEEKFINKDTNFLEYRHPVFEVMGDSSDFRMSLGQQWVGLTEETDISTNS